MEGRSCRCCAFCLFRYSKITACHRKQRTHCHGQRLSTSPALNLADVTRSGVTICRASGHEPNFRGPHCACPSNQKEEKKKKVGSHNGWEERRRFSWVDWSRDREWTWDREGRGKGRKGGERFAHGQRQQWCFCDGIGRECSILNSGRTRADLLRNGRSDIFVASHE